MPKRSFFDKLVYRNNISIVVLLESSSFFVNLDEVVAYHACDDENKENDDLRLDADEAATSEGDDESDGLPEAVVTECSFGLSGKDYTIERCGRLYHRLMHYMCILTLAFATLVIIF